MLHACAASMMHACCRLGTACKYWKEAALDDQVWEGIVTSRFGAWDAIPVSPLRPLDLPGWTFLQGVTPHKGDGGEDGEDVSESLAGVRGMDAVNAIAAAANSREAAVFSTTGRVLTRLPARWLYTRCACVADLASITLCSGTQDACGVARVSHGFNQSMQGTTAQQDPLRRGTHTCKLTCHRHAKTPPDTVPHDLRLS